MTDPPELPDEADVDEALGLRLFRQVGDTGSDSKIPPRRNLCRLEAACLQCDPEWQPSADDLEGGCDVRCGQPHRDLLSTLIIQGAKVSVRLVRMYGGRPLTFATSVRCPSGHVRVELINAPSPDVALARTHQLITPHDHAVEVLGVVTRRR